MDLKHTGVVPIVDLSRVCALTSGPAELNTQGQPAERGQRDTLAFLAALHIQLRDASQIVQTLQSVLSTRYKV